VPATPPKDFPGLTEGGPDFIVTKGDANNAEATERFRLPHELHARGKHALLAARANREQVEMDRKARMDATPPATAGLYPAAPVIALVVCVGGARNTGSAVTMQLSPAAFMVVGNSSLGQPHVGGNGMSPTRLGICASDRSNAPRLCLPLRACPS
jgi:hypothetical protein